VPLVAIIIIDGLQIMFYRLTGVAAHPSIVTFYRGIWRRDTVDAQANHLRQHRVHGVLCVVSLGVAVVGVVINMLMPRPWVPAESLLLCRAPAGENLYVYERRPLAQNRPYASTSECRNDPATGPKASPMLTKHLDGWIFKESAGGLVVLTIHDKRVVHMPTSNVAARELCEARPHFYLRSVYNLLSSPDLYPTCRQ
jgi:hypothetical protein